MLCSYSEFSENSLAHCNLQKDVENAYTNVNNEKKMLGTSYENVTPLNKKNSIPIIIIIQMEVYKVLSYASSY